MTVAVEAIAFHRPVVVGDEVSVYATIVSTGRSSMKIAVEAWRRARESDEMLKVTQAAFTFVAVGPDRLPRPVPQLASAG